MIGFKKYETFLKRKKLLQEQSKEEVNQVKDNISGIINKSSCLNGHDAAPILISETFKNEIEENYSNKAKMEFPKLFMKPRGELSLLNAEWPHFPITFASLQSLVTVALAGNVKVCDLKWCTLLRRKCISKVVVVMVDGLGVKELTTLGTWKEGSQADDQIPKWSQDEEDTSAPHVESEGPPLKKIKTASRQVSKFAVPPSFLLEALPHSCPLFPIHLEVSSPSQYSEEPIKEFFIIDLTTSFEKELLKEYENLYDAARDYKVLKVYNPVIPFLGTNDTRPHPVMPSTKRLPDQFNRLELVHCLREMIENNYPMFIQGNKAALDAEYKHLHPVVDKVTSNSPLYGVDCEMCQTANGSELTMISVINEDLKAIYTSYVKPKTRIINYLTQYSGVTRAHMTLTTTTLEDVQMHLRKILPKDAILVGHSLNFDLHAMKIVHPYVIDSSIIYNLPGDRLKKASLKLLSKLFLKKVIQRSDFRGHDPSEDARASLELVLHKLQHDASYGDRIKGGEFPFGNREMVLTSFKVLAEKRVTQRKTSLFQPAFKSSIFMIKLSKNCKRVLFATRANMKKFQVILQVNPQKLQAHTVNNENEVLQAASHSNAKFITCYIQMSDEFMNPCKNDEKKQLTELDKSLKNFYRSLPIKTLIMTVFTGSPCSVPLDKRSSAVAMIDLIGQQRQNFFRSKPLH